MSLPVLKDFQSPTQVKWCAGCGSYSILASWQKVLAESGIPRENFVMVSGIGCSGRLPYYMNTYGFHTLHGRALTVATGVQVARPELSVWVASGDGDALSIGGNHFIHSMRRNLNLKVIVFNNQIYGLTKGQFSPTSPAGTVSKTSPFGSVDTPLEPLVMALAAGCTFVGRALASEPKHLHQIMTEAAAHRGTALVEVLQNCVVFNDSPCDFDAADKVYFSLGAPLTNDQVGVRLASGAAEACARSEAAVVSVYNRYTALALAGLVKPRLLGVLYKEEKPCYADLVRYEQPLDLGGLINGADTWEVQ